MGMDVYAEHGVIGTPDQFVQLVSGKNKKVMLECLADFLEKVVETFPKDSPVQQSVAAMMNGAAPVTVAAVRQAILDVVVVEGEPSKYGGNCHLKEDEKLNDLFSEIMFVSGKADEFPRFVEVTVFSSGRFNGWDVPHGVPCVIFDDRECFKQTLSTKGKALKKIFGHTKVTEWTRVSY